jgi:curved DNA-binding protein CbpA
MIDYYALLQVEPNASTEEIRKAFRRKAKQYHPDLQQHKSEAEQREAQRRFVQLTQAYETLSHPDSRRTYDRQWSRAKGHQENQKRSANTSSSHTQRPRPETKTEDFTDFAEVTLEDLLRDVDDLLGQFGMRRADPLELLLEWAREIYREVLELLQDQDDDPPSQTSHGSRQQRTTSSSRQERPTDDPRADIEEELERLRRYQQKQGPTPSDGDDIQDELERLKKKYRP